MILPTPPLKSKFSLLLGKPHQYSGWKKMSFSVKDREVGMIIKRFVIIPTMH